MIPINREINLKAYIEKPSKKYGKVYIDPNNGKKFRFEIQRAVDGYALKTPIVHKVEIPSSLNKRINDYLDRMGVLTPTMREDIKAMIKEEEKQ